MILSSLSSIIVSLARAQITLLNGVQESILQNTSGERLAAFDTQLSCPTSVQLLPYDLSYLNWPLTDLTLLCVPNCLSSLESLEAAVAGACRDYSFEFNNGEMTACQIVDLYAHKYQTSCLADPDPDSFCLLEEQSWNVTALNAPGEATWPSFPDVTYPYFEPSVYYEFQYSQGPGYDDPAGKDYFVDTEAQPQNNGNSRVTGMRQGWSCREEGDRKSGSEELSSHK